MHPVFVSRDHSPLGSTYCAVSVPCRRRRHQAAARSGDDAGVASQLPRLRCRGSAARVARRVRCTLVIRLEEITKPGTVRLSGQP
jgi:hypothetical protein